MVGDAVHDIGVTTSWKVVRPKGLSVLNGRAQGWSCWGGASELPPYQLDHKSGTVTLHHRGQKITENR